MAALVPAGDGPLRRRPQPLDPDEYHQQVVPDTTNIQSLTIARNQLRNQLAASQAEVERRRRVEEMAVMVGISSFK